MPAAATAGARAAQAKPKRRKALRRATWLAVWLAVTVLAAAWAGGQRMLHPPRTGDGRTPDAYGLAWSWANTTAADGVALTGWWMPADATPWDNATVLFVHGYAASRHQALPIAAFLHEAGYNVLAHDLRAHGRSGGAYTTAGILEVQDAEAAIAWLKAQPFIASDPRLALFGWSMGGATALNTAALHPEVDAVVADSSFADIAYVRDHMLGPAGSLPHSLFGRLSMAMASAAVRHDLGANHPAHSIATMRAPALLIHGSADTVVAPGQMDVLAAARPGTGTLLVAGAGHVGAYHAQPQAYAEAVKAFLALNLSDEAAAAGEMRLHRA